MPIEQEVAVAAAETGSVRVTAAEIAVAVIDMDNTLVPGVDAAAHPVVDDIDTAAFVPIESDGIVAAVARGVVAVDMASR
jgi:nicotinamidase-related amidase